MTFNLTKDINQDRNPTHEHILLVTWLDTSVLLLPTANNMGGIQSI